MRIILTITVIILLAALAGCSATRKNRPVDSDPTRGAAVAEPSQEEQLPEVAPYGNAALAGKPDDADETAAHVWDFRDATTWLLGDISPAMFNNQPHSEWYHAGYAQYQPDMTIMAELMVQEKDDLTITIVLGTWCPDSRREVPRFMKIIDLWGFPKEKIRFIGTDIDKAAPLEDFSLLTIERVPTFIFFKNNVETGRIIEVPVTSLEQDTRNILTGNK
ncbi:MAG: thioredoxin family protein [Bacteroidales bacterium]